MWDMLVIEVGAEVGVCQRAQGKKRVEPQKSLFQ